MNKSKLLIILISFFTIAVLTGCNKKDKTIVAEIGKDQIYLYEFENQFLKTIGNNIDSAKKTTLEQRKDFLDLMIKLRLKVLDATDKGYLNSAEIKEDLDNYKKNYISAFLIDKVVVEPFIKELYERKKYEVRASHILINLSQTPTPEDSIKAYQKAEDAINKLKSGVSFAEVAAEFSEDPSAKINGGDLYYFTGGMTVPEFEDVVFKMNVGEYNKKPLRTMFGLHIVKITDKKKRNDGIKASHILIQDQRDSIGNVIDSMVTYTKAKEIYDKIKQGEDFAKLATEFSQDPGSAQRGGDLGFFDRRRMVQPFDSAAFSLKVGEVSTPVRTPYGWHIIKLTEIKPYPEYSKSRENLKSEFKRSPQYKTEYDKFIKKCRKDSDFNIDPNGLTFILSKVDTTKAISQQNIDSIFAEQDRSTKVASYKNGVVTVGDVLQYMNINRDNSVSPANAQTFTKIIEGASENPILTQVAIKENIDKDEDYQDLLKEYTYGLLREKIDLEQISSKIIITDEEMQSYYDRNKEKYYFVDANNEGKQKSFDEVKPEISNALRTEKFNELEKTYLESLKQKYPVKVNTDALMKAFK